MSSSPGSESGMYANAPEGVMAMWSGCEIVKGEFVASDNAPEEAIVRTWTSIIVVIRYEHEPAERIGNDRRGAGNRIRKLKRRARNRAECTRKIVDDNEGKNLWLLSDSS